MSSNINSVGWKSGENSKIDDIISQIVGWGVQRPNRYVVQFENCPVDGIGNYTFFATMVQIPQRTINYFADSVGPFSPYWDVPLKLEFDDHYIVNFLVDRDWVVRGIMEAWMDQLNGGRDEQSGYIYGNSSFNSNIQSTIGSQTYSKIIIKGVGTTDNKSKGTLTLHQAWPKLILPSQFDTSMMDQPLIMSVDFSYRYYTFVQDETL